MEIQEQYSSKEQNRRYGILRRALKKCLSETIGYLNKNHEDRHNKLFYCEPSNKIISLTPTHNISTMKKGFWAFWYNKLGGRSYEIILDAQMDDINFKTGKFPILVNIRNNSYALDILKYLKKFEEENPESKLEVLVNKITKKGELMKNKNLKKILA